MTTIIAFIIVLGILIFIHELGHFILAKLNGVGVLKFSLGFGPAIVKKRIGETEYMISAVPLGGYVKMLGEDTREEDVTAMDPMRSFARKSLKARASIVVAGPLFNLLLAIVIYMTIGWTGLPTVPPVIGTVLKDSPADQSGLKAGDRIVTIQNQPISEWDDIPLAMKDATAKQTYEIIIERNGTQFAVHVKPVMSKGTNIFGEEVSRGMIGISRPEQVIMKRLGFVGGVEYGFTQTWEIIKLTGIGVWKMINGDIDVKKSLGGPILIAQVSGQTFRAGLLPFMSMIAFISINLFLINLLPIPVLDGGHLMLFAIEGATGRPLKDRPREIAQQIGLFLLIVLMLLALYNDITRLVTGG
ncbi:MAG TPA: RIP metalloprotease RseP [Deltaproteobacteria bacterium]|nr:RIP metalloprotease RseP [Deltaproteobacteria bacterium]HOI08449.1 RIP metalloprotease RseP [Deltaproteobacteria bacterium]